MSHSWKSNEYISTHYLQGFVSGVVEVSSRKKYIIFLPLEIVNMFFMLAVIVLETVPPHCCGLCNMKFSVICV